MRLTPRHRRTPRRGTAARIAISQEEITADLNYRGERAAAGASAPRRKGGR
jgi:hypothetical protein